MHRQAAPRLQFRPAVTLEQLPSLEYPKQANFVNAQDLNSSFDLTPNCRRHYIKTRARLGVAIQN